ncbi:MAG: retroviral-like aspartic protease [Planctomycetes bacterium]|nr:retroviral-like aspartic protease [Planctomycetota bacterium]
MAPLRVIGPSGDAFLWALVDTGADQSVLPRSVADTIGLTLDQSQQSWVIGFGGQQVAIVPAEVDLQLGQAGQTFHWTATAAVVSFANVADEIVILGHAGCLDFFRTTFDGQGRELELVPTPQFPGTVHN